MRKMLTAGDPVEFNGVLIQPGQIVELTDQQWGVMLGTQRWVNPDLVPEDVDVPPSVPAAADVGGPFKARPGTPAKEGQLLAPEIPVAAELRIEGDVPAEAIDARGSVRVVTDTPNDGRPPQIVAGPNVVPSDLLVPDAQTQQRQESNETKPPKVTEPPELDTPDTTAKPAPRRSNDKGSDGSDSKA